MKPVAMVLLASLLLATAALVVESRLAPDPLAQFRTPDGQLTIPGRALTPELQGLLFGGNRLQPYYNITFLLAKPSSYPTLHPVPLSFAVPNLNVFIHPNRGPEPWGTAIDHVIREWFRPVNWNEMITETREAIRDGIGWLFDLFTVNASADTLSVDSTTVAVVNANSCTTTQTANAGDNAVLVMLSERGTTAYQSVTYGSVSLSLIPNTAQNGGTVSRTEIWSYQGSIPTGSQTMTATLGTNQRQVCATILLAGEIGRASCRERVYVLV